MVLDIEYSDRVHFAITGKSWHLLKQYFPEILPKVRFFFSQCYIARYKESDGPSRL